MRQIASEVFKNFERSCQRINSTIFLSLIFVPHLKSELQHYFPGDQNCEPSQLHLAWVLVQTEATFDSPLNQLSLFGSGLEDFWWKRYPGPNLALDNPIWILMKQYPVDPDLHRIKISEKHIWEATSLGLILYNLSWESFDVSGSRPIGFPDCSVKDQQDAKITTVGVNQQSTFLITSNLNLNIYYFKTKIWALITLKPKSEHWLLKPWIWTLITLKPKIWTLITSNLNLNTG